MLAMPLPPRGYAQGVTTFKASFCATALNKSAFLVFRQRQQHDYRLIPLPAHGPQALEHEHNGNSETMLCACREPRRYWDLDQWVSGYVALKAWGSWDT